MADFRKWLMAFAVITLLLGLGSTAVAQIPQTAPVTCTATNGAPRAVRVEGITELVGDVVLNCTGGIQTPAGQPVPLANIRIGLSTPITSRIISGTIAEAMLTIDEPYPVANPFPNLPYGAGGAIIGAPQEQIGCLATGGQTFANPFVDLGTKIGICDIAGVAIHQETYEGQYNVFQGYYNGAYIEFDGVPVDAPGSNLERIIRITNLRADVTGVPIGQPVTATISVSNNTVLTVSNPNTTVAYVWEGLTTSSAGPDYEVQCLYPARQASFPITIAEGFPSSFKTGLITDADGQGTHGNGGLNSVRTDDQASPKWQPQDLLGTPLNYYTESGFTPQLSPAPSDDPLADLVGAVAKPVLSDGSIGTADYGTRFKILINNLQNGVGLVFPNQATDGANLILQIVKSPNSDGTGGTVTNGTGNTEVDGSWTPTSGATTAFVVYEVTGDDPNLQETLAINVGVIYDSDAINLALNVPALAANSGPSTSTVLASFAPIAADTPGVPLLFKDGGVNTPTKWGSLPRFIIKQSTLDAVVVSPCSCNLLYPWFASGSGFETGLVVVNTSVSPTTWPSSPTDQTGVLTLWFNGTRNGAAVVNEFHPNPAATPAEAAITVPAGCAFSLISNIGSSVDPNCNGAPATNGSIDPIKVTKGFVGYVIATTTFQYCHGVAYVSPSDNPLQGSYVEAIQLDTPFWVQQLWNKLHLNTGNRTGQYGESQAH